MTTNTAKPTGRELDAAVNAAMYPEDHVLWFEDSQTDDSRAYCVKRAEHMQRSEKHKVPWVCAEVENSSPPLGLRIGEVPHWSTNWSLLPRLQAWLFKQTCRIEEIRLKFWPCMAEEKDEVWLAAGTFDDYDSDIFVESKGPDQLIATGYAVLAVGEENANQSI